MKTTNESIYYNQIQLSVANNDSQELKLLLALFDVNSTDPVVNSLRDAGHHLIQIQCMDNNEIIDLLNTKMNLLEILGYTPGTGIDSLDESLFPSFMRNGQATLTHNGNYIELKLPYVTESKTNGERFNNTIISLWSNHSCVIEASSNQTDLSIFN